MSGRRYLSDLWGSGQESQFRGIALYLMCHASVVASLLTHHCGEVTMRNFFVFAYVDQVHDHCPKLSQFAGRSRRDLIRRVGRVISVRRLYRDVLFSAPCLRRGSDLVRSRRIQVLGEVLRISVMDSINLGSEREIRWEVHVRNVIVRDLNG